MDHEMKDWLVVESKSGYHKDGYPIGRILCRNKDFIPEIIKDHGIHDPIITPYLEDKGE